VRRQSRPPGPLQDLGDRRRDDAERRELRARGLSPKEIACSLGMRPAAVADLVRRVAAERDAADPGADLVDCWVNAGWSTGLSIAGRPEWRDPGADDGTGGLVTALVARRRRHRRSVTVSIYLLDAYCLGVKNAMGPKGALDPRRAATAVGCAAPTAGREPRVSGPFAASPPTPRAAIGAHPGGAEAAGPRSRAAKDPASRPPRRENGWPAAGGRRPPYPGKSWRGRPTSEGQGGCNPAVRRPAARHGSAASSPPRRGEP